MILPLKKVYDQTSNHPRSMTGSGSACPILSTAASELSLGRYQSQCGGPSEPATDHQPVGLYLQQPNLTRAHPSAINLCHYPVFQTEACYSRLRGRFSSITRPFAKVNFFCLPPERRIHPKLPFRLHV